MSHSTPSVVTASADWYRIVCTTPRNGLSRRWAWHSICMGGTLLSYCDQSRRWRACRRRVVGCRAHPGEQRGAHGLLHRHVDLLHPGTRYKNGIPADHVAHRQVDGHAVALQETSGQCVDALARDQTHDLECLLFKLFYYDHLLRGRIATKQKKNKKNKKLLINALHDGKIGEG